VKRTIIQALAAQAAAEHFQQLLTPPAREPQEESIHEHVGRDQAQPTAYYRAWTTLLNACDIHDTALRARLLRSIQQNERSEHDADTQTQLRNLMHEAGRMYMDQATFLKLVAAVFPAE
jgi:hypothetical protein